MSQNKRPSSRKDCVDEVVREEFWEGEEEEDERRRRKKEKQRNCVYVYICMGVQVYMSTCVCGPEENPSINCIEALLKNNTLLNKNYVSYNPLGGSMPGSLTAMQIGSLSFSHGPPYFLSP